MDDEWHDDEEEDDPTPGCQVSLRDLRVGCSSGLVARIANGNSTAPVYVLAHSTEASILGASWAQPR